MITPARTCILVALATSLLFGLVVATAAADEFEAKLLLEGAIGPDHKDNGGGNVEITNMRVTLRNNDLDELWVDDFCGVQAIGRDGRFTLILGENVPVDLPFDCEMHALVEACYDRDGCEGELDVDRCLPRDFVSVIIPLPPVAKAHRAFEADNISDSFIFDGDVTGPSYDLQLKPSVVGTPEIENGAVTLGKLGFDTATQAELDAEQASREAADAAEEAAREAADLAEQTARETADLAEEAARVAGDLHSGDVAGPHTDLQIQPGVVGSGEIADSSILFEDLAQNGANARDYMSWTGSAWVRTPLGALPNRGTAVGAATLPNTTACCNTAIGLLSQNLNVDGGQNTSVGDASLLSNVSGARNVAIGAGNSEFIEGNDNVAIGAFGLRNVQGNGNIALGSGAGGGLTVGNNNINIGNGGAAGDDNTIRIGAGQTRTFVAGVRNSSISGLSVVVDANGRLGTSGSSPASDSHSGDVAGPSSNLQIQAGRVGSTEVNSGQVQLRVASTCPSGYSIRAISASGAVTCEYDDNSSDGYRSVHTSLYDSFGKPCNPNPEAHMVSTASHCNESYCCGFLCLDTCTRRHDYQFVGYTVR